MWEPSSTVATTAMPCIKTLITRSSSTWLATIKFSGLISVNRTWLGSSSGISAIAASCNAVVPTHLVINCSLMCRLMSRDTDNNSHMVIVIGRSRLCCTIFLIRDGSSIGVTYQNCGPGYLRLCSPVHPLSVAWIAYSFLLYPVSCHQISVSRYLFTSVWLRRGFLESVCPLFLFARGFPLMFLR